VDRLPSSEELRPPTNLRSVPGSSPFLQTPTN
jgi:hypothetical protein